MVIIEFMHNCSNKSLTQIESRAEFYLGGDRELSGNITTEPTRAGMILGRILLTIVFVTVAAVKAETLFEIADEKPEGIQECNATGLGA